MLLRKHVKFGNELRINGRIHIHGAKDKIHIGDKCVINSNEDPESVKLTMADIH